MAIINFNVSEIAPAREFKPLPEGSYEAVVIDSDIKETRAGNGRYIQLEFEVVSGEYLGRRLWGRYNIENANRDAVEIGRAQFSAVCQAAGVPAPRDTSELHNRALVLCVRCRRRRDTDELENVIAACRAKESSPAKPSAPAPQSSAAPWARK